MASTHFQIRNAKKPLVSWPGWPGTHLIELLDNNATCKWRYIKYFPSGSYSEARHLLEKLERLWPCCFLAKEYPYDPA